jgi:multicomponent Na+:H+ antiporter subunit E
MGLLHFIPIFLWFSLLSGVDVAWRTLHPQRPLEPAFIEYPWRLPPGPARIFLANVISLIPGTLGVQIKEQTLTIHVLKNHVKVTNYIHILEHYLVDLFDLSGVSDGK